MSTAESSPPTDGDTAELVRWVLDRINSHDTTSLRRIWNDETVEYFPDATCRGADELAAYFDDKFANIDGFHLDVQEIVGSGEHALVHWCLTGRHTGTVLGIAGTGRPIALDGMDHFVIRDGQVVSNTVVFDQMSFARQVGILPPDGSMADRAMKAAYNARTAALARVRRR